MKTFKRLREMAGGVGGGSSAGPTNVSGSGAVAGIGQPPGSKSGEPGVHLPRTRKRDPILLPLGKRKPLQ